MSTCIDHHPPSSVAGARRLPALDLVVGIGHGRWRRTTVDGIDADTSIADLATMIGVGPDASLTVDGEAVNGASRVLGPIRTGSRVGVTVARPAEADDPSPGAAVLDIVWVTGPDAGARVALGEGRHLVGRSRAAEVGCRDRDLELHHAVIDISSEGVATITQLCGLAPITIDGQPSDREAMLATGTRVGIGGSEFVVRPPRLDATMSPSDDGSGERSFVPAGDPWRVVFRRSPRARPVFEPVPIDVPQPARPASMFGGVLLPSMLALAGAGVMAALFGQLMFLVFGAIGALVALGTWTAQKVGVVRSRRSASRDHDRDIAEFAAALAEQRDAFERFHRACVPTIDRSIRRIVRRSPGLWAVRSDDPDAFSVCIGIGDVTWQPRLAGADRTLTPDLSALVERHSTVRRMPVAASCAAGTVTALVGSDGRAAATSILLQLAASSGPADWQLMIVTEREGEWGAFAWLPHATDPSGSPMVCGPGEVAEYINGLDPDDCRHLVVVIEGTELLAVRTSPVRRLMGTDRSVAVLAICADEVSIPAVATSALITGRSGSARWVADTRVTALADVLRITGVAGESALVVATSLAGLVDPEVAGGSTAIARNVGLTKLLEPQIGIDRSLFGRRIAQRWADAGADPAPSAPIGLAADGIVEIDLVADGPHGLVAGTTGAGKSELLRSLVVGLAVRCSPDHITFVLVDYKGGSAFDACAELPHVVGLVTDLDDRLGARALRSLEAELRRREQLFRDAGVGDLAAYRSVRDEPLPRLVVVIDEFAALATQQPAFIGALLGVAQRGRSLGVHLLLATQRPGGVVDDDIRANTNLRIALRVQDRSDALDVIGDAGAAALPRSVPGRAMMRLGADAVALFQTACCTGPDDDGTELQVLVAAIREAVMSSGIAAPHRPWLPDLGTDVQALLADSTTPDSDTTGALGVIDDPDAQRRIALRWQPEDGHLLLAGATGSGTTTALLGIAAALARAERDRAVELFVIDAMGDARLGLLQSLPGCAAVVRLHEVERLMRVIDALAGEVAARKASTAPATPHDSTGAASTGDGGTIAVSAGVGSHDIVVIIDGLTALRTELESIGLYDRLQQLDLVVTEGRSVGISLVVATSRPAALPTSLLGQIGERWVFHLSDPSDAITLGVAPSAVPGPIPGRLVDARTGRDAQIAGLDEQILLDLACRVTSGTPPAIRPLGVLASSVPLSSLPGAATDGGDAILPIGLSFEDTTARHLPVAAGDHVLVIGPSRSGRTTALRSIVRAWGSAHPDGWVASIGPRRSSVRVGSVFDEPAVLLASMPEDPSVPRLVVIDDAELVEDVTGGLATLIGSRVEGVTVIAAGRPDALRSAYGHWTTAARRSRLGLVMAACSDLDGDLLGTSLPRRLPIPARPGLAWLVADGERQLIQVATPDAPDAPDAPVPGPGCT